MSSIKAYGRIANLIMLGLSLIILKGQGSFYGAVSTVKSYVFIFTHWVKTETGNETVLHPVFIGYTPEIGFTSFTD